MEQGIEGEKEGADNVGHLASPDVILETFQPAPGVALVELLWVPEQLRRQGLGARAYRNWEAGLSEGSRVELYAVDAEAEVFWQSVGFRHVEYADQDHVGGHMIKIIARREHKYQAWQRCGDGFDGEENMMDLPSLVPFSV